MIMEILGKNKKSSTPPRKEYSRKQRSKTENFRRSKDYNFKRTWRIHRVLTILRQQLTGEIF